jgi:hypothetical protein
VAPLDAFGKLNDEARGDNGFLAKISKPINEAIDHWGVRFDMSVNAPDDITKLVKHTFAAWTTPPPVPRELPKLF